MKSNSFHNLNKNLINLVFLFNSAHELKVFAGLRNKKVTNAILYARTEKANTRKNMKIVFSDNVTKLYYHYDQLHPCKNKYREEEAKVDCKPCSCII